MIPATCALILTCATWRLGLAFRMADERIKVAKDLPPPPALSAADLQRIDDEAQIWRAAVAKGTASLERLTSEDLRIRLR